MVTGYNKTDFARNAYKVMVDIDKEELNKHSDIIDELVHADAFEFLDLINKKIPDDYSSSSKWLKTCVDLNKKYPLTQRLLKTKMNGSILIILLMNYQKIQIVMST